MLANRLRQRTTDNGQRTTNQRRGVTLVEMLVTVAVLVIMMTILVQIFQAATGSVSAAQAFQQLDDQLRRLDGIIRADLEGVTARFTPPLDPAQNLGYFEYGENEFADNQGEDSDDYIRFTAKAPAGRPFTGRIAGSNYFAAQRPRSSTLDNLASSSRHDHQRLRRDHLLPPQRQPVSPRPPDRARAPVGDRRRRSIIGINAGYAFYPDHLRRQPVNYGHVPVSWQGVNDLSAQAPTGRRGQPRPATIVLNTLGDLTNRENRAFMPRFANDFSR